MAKKRRAPRKRATTPQQVMSQLSRYHGLLNKWLDKQDVLISDLAAAQKKIKHHRNKISYYQKRLPVVATAGSRALRAIQLDEGIIE